MVDLKNNSLVNVVLNDFTNDSRVLKICNSLSNYGFTVTVLALHNEGLKIKEYKNNIFINRLKLLSRSWYKYKLIQLLKYCEFIVRAVVFCRNKDILHCNDLSTLPVGILSKIFSKNTKLFTIVMNIKLKSVALTVEKNLKNFGVFFNSFYRRLLRLVTL